MAAAPEPARLRRPTAADLDALAGLHARSWQVTYGPLLDESERALLTVGERRAVWARVLADPQPRDSVWLAEADGRIVGLVWAGLGQDPDSRRDGGAGADRDVGEIHAIHVAPGLHGRGIGRLLLDAALGDLRDEGFTLARLWVIRENAEARRFYERQGWRPDGREKRGHMGDFPGLPLVVEVRYARALDAGTGPPTRGEDGPMPEPGQAR